MNTTINPNPLEKGVPEVGSFLWLEVQAPENVELLEGDESARKLSKKALRALNKKIRLSTLGIQLYEFNKAQATIKELTDKLRKTQKQHVINAITLRIDKLKQVQKPRVSFWARLFGFRIPEFTEDDYKEAKRFIYKAQKRLREHEIALENERLYDALAQEMQLEVDFFAKQLIERWSALKQRDEVFINGKRKLKKIQIEEAHFTPDEIQYKIKVSTRSIFGSVKHHLPYDSRARFLVGDEETLAELTAATQRPVSSPHVGNDPQPFENGVWVTVYREGLTDGLFNYIELNVLMDKYNQAHRAKLPAPIGVMRGRVVKWLYLSDTPHMMFNGITGSGKTNCMVSMLAAWSTMNSPKEVRFFIVDLKRGVDFNIFEGIPHTVGEILRTTDELALLVPKLVKLMYERLKTFSSSGVVDINAYNQLSPEEIMPHILLVVDECMTIAQLADRTESNAIWNALTIIASQARAAGIHLMLGTQQSFTDSIPRAVGNNITFAYSGRQRTLAGSLGTFGDGRAKNMPKIRGRAWVDDNGDFIYLQSPYCSPEYKRKAVEAAKLYERVELVLPDADEDMQEQMMLKSFDVEDVIAISITQFEGIMSQHKIHALVKDKPNSPSRAKISELIKEVGSMGEVVFDSERYKAVANRGGWRLEKIKDNATSHQYVEPVYSIDNGIVSESNGNHVEEYN